MRKPVQIEGGNFHFNIVAYRLESEQTCITCNICRILVVDASVDYFVFGRGLVKVDDHGDVFLIDEVGYSPGYLFGESTCFRTGISAVYVPYFA